MSFTPPLSTSSCPDESNQELGATLSAPMAGAQESNHETSTNRPPDQRILDTPMRVDPPTVEGGTLCYLFDFIEP
jgi:hypothetical protein